MILIEFFCLFLIKLSPVFSDTVNSINYLDDYVPCENGWYYFRNNCYRFERGRNLKGNYWSEALAKCREYGADLASIESQEEQDFINGLLLENEYVPWIGLIESGNGSGYRWSDGSVFNYTNWYTGKPSGLGDQKEDCIYLYLNPIGKWTDYKCDADHDYVCKMNANPGNRSPNLMYCSSVEGGGWKYDKFCYHEVTEVKSWEEAEKHCKNNYKGHLLSVQDVKEDLFLEYALPNIKKEIWIGIKIKDRLQQKWTSGWYVSLDKFSKEEKYVEGTCVARKNQSKWIMIPCSRQLPFICKVSKETPPVLKPPPIGSYCPKALDDWRDLGGDYCYYIETETKVNFSEARSHCQRRGGDLVSIHSQEETDILHPFLKYTAYRYTEYSIYIGLIRVKGNTDPIFRWTDGSVYDYKNWNDNEPNKIEEECVTAYIHTMKWNDMFCSNKESGYICSVKKIMMSNSKVVDETAGCSSHIYLKNLIGVSVCIHLVMSLLGVVV